MTTIKPLACFVVGLRASYPEIQTTAHSFTACKFINVDKIAH